MKRDTKFYLGFDTQVPRSALAALGVSGAKHGPGTAAKLARYWQDCGLLHGVGGRRKHYLRLLTASKFESVLARKAEADAVRVRANHAKHRAKMRGEIVDEPEDMAVVQERRQLQSLQEFAQVWERGTLAGLVAQMETA